MIVKETLELHPDREFIKIVVDVAQDTIAAYCDLHIDCAQELIEHGSKSDDLWGANVFTKDKSIAYQSMINISPARGNRSMEIGDATIRQKVKAVIDRYLP